MGRWPHFVSMHSCKRFLKFWYMRLCRPSSIAATSSTMACLSYWIITIRLSNTWTLKSPHKKNSGTLRSGNRAGQAISPNQEIATAPLRWSSVDVRHPNWQYKMGLSLLPVNSRQLLWPAIALLHYSWLKCVSYWSTERVWYSAYVDACTTAYRSFCKNTLCKQRPYSPCS